MEPSQSQGLTAPQVITAKRQLEFLIKRYDRFEFSFYVPLVMFSFLLIGAFSILAAIKSVLFLFGVVVFLIPFCSAIFYPRFLSQKIKLLKTDQIAALSALSNNMPTLFNSAANGAKGYVSDIAYKLLSKWIKEDHCPAEHPHIQSEIIDLRLTLSLLNLHYPQLIDMGDDNLPAGQFAFENVREKGNAALEWKLLNNGLFEFKLIHGQAYIVIK